MKRTALACLLCLCLGAAGGFGLEADLRSVEIDLVVRPDGRA